MESRIAETTKYSLIYESEGYPLKYVISRANIFVNGEELDPNEFSGGEESNNFLKTLGFIVTEKQGVPNVNYWVEKTIVSGRPDREEGPYSLGRALWSPQVDRGGAKRYENMKEPKPGDIVLHLVNKKAFKGVSIVDEPYDDSFYCLPNTQWDFNRDGKTPGYYIKLREYTPLDPPLHRNWLLVEQKRKALNILNKNRKLFYASDLNLRQGAYLTKAPKELVKLLDEIYVNKTGQHIPYISISASNIALI